MDFEDLQRRWEEQNRKLDSCLRLNTQILNQSILSKAEAATRRLSWLLLLQMPVVALVVLGSFRFIARHTTEPRFLIPAVALLAYTLFFTAFYIHQVIALRSIDYSAPILDIQKRLGAIRVERVWIEKWMLVTAPFFWVLLLIVVPKTKGFNVYEMFGDAWVIANALFGVAVILVAIWASRRYADRMESSPYIQHLMRDLAGHNLNAALGFVGSLERFEKEESPA